MQRCLNCKHNVTGTLPPSPRRSTAGFLRGTGLSPATRCWASALSSRRNLMGAKCPPQPAKSSGRASATLSWSITMVVLRWTVFVFRGRFSGQAGQTPRIIPGLTGGCAVVVDRAFVSTPFFLSLAKASEINDRGFTKVGTAQIKNGFYFLIPSSFSVLPLFFCSFFATSFSSFLFFFVVRVNRKTTTSSKTTKPN
jgi:hypothetical protein